MTKTLTEQWREGTLPDGFYYMKDYAGGYNYRYLLGVKPDADFVKFFKEVLAPVPSYDEYKKLEQQLAELQTEENNLLNDIIDLNLTIENREKQLDEANEVIKTTNRVSGNIDLSQLVYEDRRKIDGITMQTESYLEKWGVK